MRGQPDPWEMTVFLESLKRHWVVSCNARSQDEKGGISRNKYGVSPIPLTPIPLTPILCFADCSNEEPTSYIF